MKYYIRLPIIEQVLLQISDHASMCHLSLSAVKLKFE